MLRRVQLYGGPQDGLIVILPGAMPRMIRCHLKTPVGVAPCGTPECVYRLIRGRYTYST